MRAQSVDFLTDIERAVRFYYLLRLTFAARMKAPSFGLQTERRSRWNPDRFESHFRDVSRRLKGVTIECLEYGDLIKRYDRPWTLFYCDPPFIGSEDVYNAVFPDEDHEGLADILRNIKGRFILSYNDHPDAWRFYEGLQFRQVKGHYSISREPDGRRSFGELIITNF
jgi:DNA adenine methylase